MDWTNTSLTWSVDGKVVHTQTDPKKIPSEPLSIRIIFRTARGTLAAMPASQVWLQNLSYKAPT